MWRVPLFDLEFDHQEEDAVLEVLRSKWLTQGERTKAFEEAFAGYLGGGVDCAAVSSCTAALHLALLVAGVGPGDEVIVPGVTFVADINVVAMTGATPVLADVTSLDDWNIDPADVARKITPRTKAVNAVHYGGYPCDKAALASMCAPQGIVLIEDAAHAVGAKAGKAQCGTLGDMACFSFFSNKNMSVGEGGMFVARSEEHLEKARLLRCHGMTSLTVDRHAGRSISYDVRMPGLNYRMDEIRAALGLIQLDKLEANNIRRRAVDGIYREHLAGSELQVPFGERPAHETSSAHIFPVLLPKGADRAGFMNAMRESGVQTSLHYPAFESFSAYADIKPAGDVTREVTDRVVTLPLYPAMTDEDVRYVVGAANQALEKLAQARKAA